MRGEGQHHDQRVKDGVRVRVRVRDSDRDIGAQDQCQCQCQCQGQAYLYSLRMVVVGCGSVGLRLIKVLSCLGRLAHQQRGLGLD